MGIINLCTRFYTTYLKSIFEYRLVFLADMFTNIITYSAMYLGIWILLDRFKVIQGWTFYEVMLLFNLNMVSYGLSSFIFRWPMLGLEQMVQRGEFDIVLIRPMNPLLYTILRRTTLAYVGHMILGTIVFAICFANLDIQWTLIKVIFLVFAIMGAVLIHSTMYLIIGKLSFWIVRTYSVFSTLMYSFRNFIDYPISIYGKVLQALLTFVIPFAFINFYPAQYFLDRKGDTLFHPILQYGTPVVGIVLFLLAYKFWTIGVNRYESTGS